MLTFLFVGIDGYYRWLAREIIAVYHGREAGEQADQEWLRVVSNKEVPSDMEECRLASSSCKAVDIVMQAGLAPSKREARRLVEQGAVIVAGEPWNDPNKVYEVADGSTLKVGKRWRLLRV